MTPITMRVIVKVGNVPHALEHEKIHRTLYLFIYRRIRLYRQSDTGH